jgi:hypothetical protein
MELQPSLSLQALDTVLVTQLAALIHLKEYNRAKALWKRYSSLAHNGVNNNDKHDNHSPLPQFVNLWRALTPLIRFHAQDFIGSTTNATSNAETMSFENMQIATIYKSLNKCITGDNLLSAFARELQLSIRDTMANTIECVYEVITMDQCKSLLGFSTISLCPLEKAIQQQQQQLDMEEYLLKERHWTFERNSGLWIPNKYPAIRDGKDSGLYDSRIQYLTKYSEFLERQRLNA